MHIFKSLPSVGNSAMVLNDTMKPSLNENLSIGCKFIICSLNKKSVYTTKTNDLGFETTYFESFKLEIFPKMLHLSFQSLARLNAARLIERLRTDHRSRHSVICPSNFETRQASVTSHKTAQLLCT